MIKLFLLMIFLMLGIYPLRADQDPAGDNEFITALNIVKSPFESGLPKPVVVVQPPIVQQQAPSPVVVPKPKPKRIIVPVVLPALKLEGVMVGDGVHQAIINDQVVPLQGIIEGAKVISVNKEGVELLFKRKKFFLKVD